MSCHGGELDLVTFRKISDRWEAEGPLKNICID